MEKIEDKNRGRASRAQVRSGTRREIANPAASMAAVLAKDVTPGSEVDSSLLTQERAQALLKELETEINSQMTPEEVDNVIAEVMRENAENKLLGEEAIDLLKTLAASRKITLRSS